jgi:hypothetical protein
MATKLMLDWIDALESGKYTQTKAQLGYQNCQGDRSYCCLGVLCEIAGVESRVDVDGAIEFDGLQSLPPPNVIDLLFDRESGEDWDDNVVLFEDETGMDVKADKANDALEKYVDA